MHLTKAEADAMELRIAEVEARTGVQVVAAIVGRSDAYPEIAWKAFAMGAAVAALAVVCLDMLRPDWMPDLAVWSNVVPILGAGAASAILTLVLPAYARLYLEAARRDGEVRQRAQALFHERKLARTRGRDAVLLLASVFERRVEVIADVGFDGRVEPREWRGVVDAMTPAFAGADPAEALSRGVEAVESLLRAKGIAGSRVGDELPDRPIDEAGA
ncbi:MAG: TPM domain-containing protein [Casimicrobiaceae bacterium]